MWYIQQISTVENTLSPRPKCHLQIQSSLFLYPTDAVYYCTVNTNSVLLLESGIFCIWGGFEKKRLECRNLRRNWKENSVPDVLLSMLGSSLDGERLLPP